MCNSNRQYSYQFPLPQASLLSMALYDTESSLMLPQSFEAPSNIKIESLRATATGPNPSAYSIDEYRDLSLRQILELSEDFLFDDDSSSESCYNARDEDPLMPNPVFPLLPSAPAAQVSSFASLPFSSHPHQVQQPLDSKFDAAMLEPIPLPLPTPSCCTSFPVAPIPTVSSVQLQQDFSSKKRCREMASEEDDDDVCSVSSEFEQGDFEDAAANQRRFRPYQKGQWAMKYDELLEFRKEKGEILGWA